MDDVLGRAGRVSGGPRFLHRLRIALRLVVEGVGTITGAGQENESVALAPDLAAPILLPLADLGTAEGFDFLRKALRRLHVGKPAAHGFDDHAPAHGGW